MGTGDFGVKGTVNWVLWSLVIGEEWGLVIGVLWGC